MEIDRTPTVHYSVPHRFRLLPVALLATAFLVAGCGKSQPGIKAAAPEPTPVVVAKVQQKTMPVQIEAIATVEAYSTVSIKPQVSGPLLKVHFREGDDVRKGQLLFTIDPRPFQAALSQAQAQLEKDKTIAANNRVQSKRYLELFKEGVTARQQSDDLLSAAEAQESQVRSDEANIQAAKLNLEYCSIHSPISGRTGNLMVHEGNLVKANDVPILVMMNQLQPILVNFAIPEQALADVKKFRSAGSLRVSAVIPNDPGPPEQGTLSFVDNAVDNTTGTIHLKGVFANAQKRLWPGQFVNVVLTLTSAPNSLVVPTQAISSGQNGSSVYVVKSDNSVEARSLVVGRAVAGETIVEKGLHDGETVIIDGQSRVAPGMHVKIKPPAASASSGS